MGDSVLKKGVEPIPVIKLAKIMPRKNLWKVYEMYQQLFTKIEI